MRKIIEQILRWLVKYSISFFLILVVLFAGNYVRQQYQLVEAIKTEITFLESGIPEIQEFILYEKKSVFERTSVIDKKIIERIEDRINQVEAEIAIKSSSRNAINDLFITPVSKRIIDGYKLDVEIELLRQEKEYLLQLRSIAKARIEIEAGKVELERRRLFHEAKHKQYQEKNAEFENAFRDSKISWSVSSSGSQTYYLFGNANKIFDEKNNLAKATQNAQSEYNDQKKLLEMSEQTIAIKHEAAKFFLVNEAKIKDILNPLKIALQDKQNYVKENWITKIQNPSISLTQIAIMILAGAILVPIGIKSTFYFLFALLASNRPPICILPKTSGSIDGLSGSESFDSSRISSVSVKLKVDDSHELLLHPEFLQTSSVHGKADTKLLLDWSCPLSSVASGLIGLTRFRSDNSEVVVVSSTKDPFSEIATLSLPEDSALVFQPRSIVGVLYRKGHPVKISRHWRIWSLHAWLTLQLRYLVFHGPATLIVRGCRGVRVEKAGKGRRINQASTMGFSANLLYSTTRTETFLPYLMGEQELFVDSFDGGNGHYIYEEMPNYGDKSGIAGRGLAGLTDSILKIFGI